MQSPQQPLPKLFTNPNTHSLLQSQLCQLTNPYTIKCLTNCLLCITLALPSTAQHYSFNLYPAQIQFMIVIGKGFPVCSPRIHIKTNNLTSIAFDDCRNLLYEILENDQWKYTIRLKDIQGMIVKFLGRLDKLQNGIYQIARLGQFQLNTVFPMQLIKMVRNQQIMYGFILDHENNLKMYAIDICSTHFCMFLTEEQPCIDKNNGNLKIPAQTQITAGVLVFFAELGCITQILINRTDFKQLQIKFTSNKPHNMHLSTVTITKKLRVRKGQHFLKKLIQNISKYNIMDIKFQPIQQHIKIQQKQYLQIIEKAQKQLEKKFNKNTISYLNDCYQKIVQYYSSQNLPFYAVFVEKITVLLHRKDVRLIMEGEQLNTAQKQSDI